MIPPLSNQRIDSMFSAVCLFSDKTPMASKCIRIKKGAQGTVCYLCSHHILMYYVIYCDQGGRQHGIYLFKYS